MKKTQINLHILYIVFASSLVLANVIAAKLFFTGFNLFGGPVVITAGAIVYPVTFLVTDTIGELWGKKQAQTAVILGLFAQVFALGVILIALALPAVEQPVQDAMAIVLGQNWVFVLASLSAYFVSQTLDVKIFHSVREWGLNKFDQNSNMRWIWNNASTGISQFIDSAIFVLIAFGLGFGWLMDGLFVPLITMIIGQYVFKLVIALLDTPIFYLLTKNSKA